ncbi:MAG: ABC transporter permease subunit [Clostridiales bacterium]|nr:ABC transporter permease subunit [Clostridiales bacterium]
MSKVLFKVNIKSNWPIFLFITCMLLLYTTISVGMFDPINAETTQAMLGMMPESMVKAFGFEGLGTELTGYLGNYLYGFIFLVFPMIYTVLVSNKLIAKHVDTGSMTYLLTTPHSRIVIARTQAIFLALSTFAVLLINVLVAVVMSEIMFSGMLKIVPFLALNLITYLCLLVISSMGFFFSCLFNDTKNSLAFGTAFPVIFVVLKMVSGISDELSFLKYFTLYSLVDVNKILDGGSYSVVVGIILLIAASIIYTVSIKMFDKRSLSI